MLAQWLKEALAAADMKQAELARRLSKKLGRTVDKAAVNKMTLETRDISGEELLAIADITGYALPGYALMKIPVLSFVSAGRLTEMATQVVATDAPLIVVPGLGPGDFFALQVDGDSMDRLSPEHSVIVVNRENTTLVPGKPFVFSIRGEATYKLWRPTPPRLDPYSTNPSHQPLFVEDADDLVVIGRVRRTLLDL